MRVQGNWRVIAVPATALTCALFLTALSSRGEEGSKQSGPAAGAAPHAKSEEKIAKAAADMAQAAQNFWAGLTPEQQKKASFPFDDKERFNWHFIPRERKGLPWKDMSPEQQHLAHVFLSSGLSSHGYAEAETIMSLEQVLKELEHGKGPARDPLNYAFTVFGTPGPKTTWGWRVEGHHPSLNFTIADGKP